MHQLSRRGALLTLAGAAWAKQQPQNPYTPDDGGVIRVDTRLVVLHCAVQDGDGRLITNLAQKDFKVYENKVEQPVKVFRREDIPVSIGLVIDNSGSMRTKRKRVEAAAIQLVKASNPQDEVFVVNFNDEAYRDVDFTSDIKKMETGLARLDSRGGTAFRDAVSMSMDYMKQYGRKDKKVLLVVSDGDDTASVGITLEALVDKCHKNNILVYGIGLLDKEEKNWRNAKRALDALVKASGGAAYYPGEVDEVESVAKQVAHDIRNQYVIAYSPLNQNLDGTFRTIRVTAGRYTVRTRSGYYATPEAPGRKG